MSSWVAVLALSAVLAATANEPGCHSGSDRVPQQGPGTFTPVSLPEHGKWPAVVGLGDGRVVIAGGDLAPRSAELFDAERGEFAPGPSLAAARLSPEIVALPGGEALVVGGSNDDGEPDPYAELYRP